MGKVARQSSENLRYLLGSMPLTPAVHDPAIAKFYDKSLSRGDRCRCVLVTEITDAIALLEQRWES